MKHWNTSFNINADIENGRAVLYFDSCEVNNREKINVYCILDLNDAKEVIGAEILDLKSTFGSDAYNKIVFSLNNFSGDSDAYYDEKCDVFRIWFCPESNRKSANQIPVRQAYIGFGKQNHIALFLEFDSAI